MHPLLHANTLILLQLSCQFWPVTTDRQYFSQKSCWFDNMTALILHMLYYLVMFSWWTGLYFFLSSLIRGKNVCLSVDDFYNSGFVIQAYIKFQWCFFLNMLLSSIPADRAPCHGDTSVVNLQESWWLVQRGAPATGRPGPYCWQRWVLDTDVLKAMLYSAYVYTYATILFVTVCNCHMSCVLHCHSERVCWQPEPRGWQGEPCSIFMGGWEVSESAWKCKYSSVKLDSLLHQSHTRVSLKDNSNWVLSCELAGDFCYPIKCLCLKHWMCLYQLYLKMPFSFPS